MCHHCHLMILFADIECSIIASVSSYIYRVYLTIFEDRSTELALTQFSALAENNN